MALNRKKDGHQRLRLGSTKTQSGWAGLHPVPLLQLRSKRGPYMQRGALLSSISVGPDPKIWPKPVGMNRTALTKAPDFGPNGRLL